MSIVALPLKDMSHADKLRVMEELWDDLCHSPEGVPSPEWHGEVLAERQRLTASGEAQFLDWEDVKASLLGPRE